MQIKNVPPVNVLSFSARTTLADLDKYAITVPKQLYAEAARLGLMVTGPLHWKYLGADGKKDSLFTLEIAVPIERIRGIDTAYTLKEWPGIKCIAGVHEGEWDLFPETYGKVISWLMREGYTMSGESREVYLNIDMDSPAYNRAEVQIGIV